MAKKIVIVAHFTGDFSATDNSRFLYLAKELAKENEVEVITSDFSHFLKRKKNPVSVAYPFKVTYLEEPPYKKNISPQRLLSHRAWGKKLKAHLEAMEKPDVIYTAIPSLSGPGYAAEYCRKNGVRLVIDVQDLWPEAFKMVLNIPVLSNILFAPMQRLVDNIYRSADSICAVSQTYADTALKKNHKCQSGTAVFLGTNLDTFDAYSREEPIVEKPEGEIWLGYCGTLGNSYDLICVFDALKILADKGMTIPFIIVGDGPRRAEFAAYASDRQLDVRFLGAVPYNKLCAILCRCDIAVNPIIHNAAASIINKHSDYAASGLPVLNTQESREYRKLVDDYRMGFNCNNGDAADLADKLELLIRDDSLRREMGKNARRCAEERFDRKNSYKALIQEIVKD